MNTHHENRAMKTGQGRDIMQIPVRVPAEFTIIAHRGASAYAPENTFPAFDLALRMGRPHVELDTQLSTDGRVALCHDTTLTRYGHGDREIESLSWAETLSHLDMGAWFSPYLFAQTPMLTLDRLFDHYGDRLFYHVEIKGKASGLPQAVHRLITQYDLHASCIVTSFSYGALEVMRELDDAMRLGWLIRDITPQAVEQAAALSLFQLCPLAANVTGEQVSQARQAVAQVRAWGLM
jgi:glycerophosphoryl diester phosphodiesterase